MYRERSCEGGREGGRVCIRAVFQNLSVLRVSAHHKHVLFSLIEMNIEDGGVSRVISCQFHVGDLFLALGLEVW